MSDTVILMTSPWHPQRPDSSNDVPSRAPRVRVRARSFAVALVVAAPVAALSWWLIFSLMR